MRRGAGVVMVMVLLVVVVVVVVRDYSCKWAISRWRRCRRISGKDVIFGKGWRLRCSRGEEFDEVLGIDFLSIYAFDMITIYLVDDYSTGSWMRYR